jgi:hypothetical protein
MGDELESEVGTCGIADDLDTFRLNSGRYEMFDRYYSLFQLSRKGGRWHEACKSTNQLYDINLEVEERCTIIQHCNASIDVLLCEFILDILPKGCGVA